MFSWIEFITIICIFLCFFTTNFQIYQHMKHYTNPAYQKRIIMILLMPPIYIFFSTLTIWTNDDNGCILLIRNIYESLVIYSFFKLLGAYVGYDPEKQITDDINIEDKICSILGGKGVHPYQCPMNYCLKPMNLVNVEEAHKIYWYCRTGILQYIPVKISLAILMLILVEQESTGFLYDLCSFIEFISVSIALYWLVFFFHIFYEDLSPYKPLMKFLIIKGILFVTFWQELVLSFLGVPLSHSNYIPPENRKDADIILSCMLVDIEMVIMSILTTFAFSYMDFKIGKEKKIMSLRVMIKAKMCAIRMHHIAKTNSPGKPQTCEVEQEDFKENIETKNNEMIEIKKNVLEAEIEINDDNVKKKLKTDSNIEGIQLKEKLLNNEL